MRSKNNLLSIVLEVKKFFIILIGFSLGIYITNPFVVRLYSATDMSHHNEIMEKDDFIKTFLSRGILHSFNPHAQEATIETRFPITNEQVRISFHLGKTKPLEIIQIHDQKNKGGKPSQSPANFEDIVTGSTVGFYPFISEKDGEIYANTLYIYDDGPKK